MNVQLINILSIEPDGDDGMIVTFSDGTTDAYVVEELLQLRPHREPTAASVKNAQKTPLSGLKLSS